MRLENRMVSVTLANDVCTIRRSGRSTVTIANVLGIEQCDDLMVETVWLDRLVHMPSERTFDNGHIKWEVSGAVSSILRRNLAITESS